MSVVNMEKEAIETNLESKIKSNETLYTSSLSHILYEVDRETMVTLLNAMYLDKEIVGINLTDYSGTMNISLQAKQVNNQSSIKSYLNLSLHDIPLGTLEIEYTKDYMQSRLATYEKIVFGFSLTFTLVLLLILFHFISKATRSLEELSRATDKISEGDLSHEIHIDSNDEIGSLANKFEAMRKNLLERRALNEKQSREISVLNEDMYTTQKIIIETLGEVIEKRYVDDPNHIKRVAQMSYILAQLLGLSEEDAKTLKIVSPMHDIGKIGISDAILLKPSKSTPEEFELMKDHSVIGYNILKNTNKKTLDIAALVAYEHHEAWDGSGYPRGLKGEEISIFGRITALLDVYDALANKRCYKEAWDQDDVKKYISENSGILFDPTMTKVFIEHFDQFAQVQEIYKNN
jgi:response regulator RpfG family c-di-GMP phosphodiesterase